MKLDIWCSQSEEDWQFGQINDTIMNDRTLFSIIIPVYNVAPYLRECLDSVLAAVNKLEAQAAERGERRPVEVLCVDDGSTDGSGAILDEYASKDARFRVIHQPNRGVSAARNAALDVSNGEYVWFVDGDDAVHPQSLSWIAEVLGRHEGIDAFCFGKGYLVGVEIPNVWPDLGVFSGRVETLVRHDSTSFMAHRENAVATIERRATIGDIRFADLKVNEDGLFHSECFWHGERWLYCEAPLYFYRKRMGSVVMTPPTVAKTRDFIAAQRLILLLFKKNREKWSHKEMQQCLRWNGDFSYLTFNSMFLHLPAHLRSELLAEWVDLQNLQFLVSSQKPMWRSLVVWVTSVSHSSVLCKLLVLLPYYRLWLGRVKQKAKRILHI